MNRPDWDAADPETLRDQRAAYDTMRESCPVAYSELLGWSLFRHNDIVGVLADPATYRSASTHRAIPNGMDPPEHTHYRNALTSFFEPAEMMAFESRCRAIATELSRTVARRGQLDLIGEFAEPLSLRAACDFLGWPENVWSDLQGWMHGNQETALSRDRGAAKRAAEEVSQFVNEAIATRQERASDPGDITSQLMATEVEGQALSSDDIVSILRNWIAGHGTVAAGLGILVFHLASDQTLQRRLRHDPTLVAAAVDEILRVDGPLVANRRTTASPVEIGGRHIGEGEKLTLMWIAADRDERVFANPDRIELDRNEQDNLLFGAGIHDCLGAPLARLELRVAVEELLAHTSAIELDRAAAPIRSVYPSNGFSTLPVHLVSA